MSEGIRIALADLHEWLQKEIAPLIEPLEAKSKSLVKEVKKRLEDMRENDDRIFVKSDKEIQKGSSKTYRCAKAANKMSKNISDMIDKIVVPEDISYENLRLLLEDLDKTLAAIDHERRAWYPQISPYFILDRRRLDVAVKRAEVTIQELRGFWSEEYVEVKTAESTLAMIDKISQLIEEAKDLQKRRNQAETRAKLAEEKIRKDEQKIELIQDKAELNELSKLEQKIRDLKAKVKYDLRHLQKPFYKMQSLARRAQVAITPDEVRKIQQYMRNPFEALSSEQDGYPVLKRIVQKMDDGIRSGKLKLKSARMRKARRKIDDILKRNSLANLHRNCLEAVSTRKQLQTSETVTTTQTELKNIQTRLRKLQNEKKHVESRRKVLEEEHQRLLKKIETQRTELEKSVFELIDKKIQVVFQSQRD